MLSFHKDGCKFCLAPFYHSVSLNHFVEQEDTAGGWSNMFGEIPEKLDPQFVNVSMEKVVLCSNEQF